jgi:hypothetical protein
MGQCRPADMDILLYGTGQPIEPAMVHALHADACQKTLARWRGRLERQPVDPPEVVEIWFA